MQEREKDIELPSIKEKKDIEEETDAKNAEVLESVTRSPQDSSVGLIQECNRNKIEQSSHDCEVCGKTLKSHHNMKEDSLVEESDLQEDSITQEDIELTLVDIPQDKELPQVLLKRPRPEKRFSDTPIWTLDISTAYTLCRRSNQSIVPRFNFLM